MIIICINFIGNIYLTWLDFSNFQWYDEDECFSSSFVKTKLLMTLPYLFKKTSICSLRSNSVQINHLDPVQSRCQMTAPAPTTVLGWENFKNLGTVRNRTHWEMLTVSEGMMQTVKCYFLQINTGSLERAGTYLRITYFITQNMLIKLGRIFLSKIERRHQTQQRDYAQHGAIS